MVASVHRHVALAVGIAGVGGGELHPIVEDLLEGDQRAGVVTGAELELADPFQRRGDVLLPLIALGHFLRFEARVRDPAPSLAAAAIRSPSASWVEANSLNMEACMPRSCASCGAWATA